MNRAATLMLPSDSIQPRTTMFLRCTLVGGTGPPVCVRHGLLAVGYGWSLMRPTMCKCIEGYEIGKHSVIGSLLPLSFLALFQDPRKIDRR